MPHATGDEMMEDSAEAAIIREYLEGQVNGIERNDNHEREARLFDQTGKLDTAEDYEDISDDELPEEEEARNHPDSDEERDEAYDNIIKSLQKTPEQPHSSRSNGYTRDLDAPEQHDGNVLGEPDESYDPGLFDEHSSSPEHQRAVPNNHAHPPPQRPGGLALPSRSALALPGPGTSHQPSVYQQTQRSAQSMSPPSSFQDDDHLPIPSVEIPQMPPAGMSQAELTQWKLLNMSKRRQAGEIVDEDSDELDLDFIYSVFPRFETNQVQNFVDLFPPRPVTYRGRVPLKAPRPVQPTKLSLDLLPDQEKSFRAPILAKKPGADQALRDGLVYFNDKAGEGDSDDDLAWSVIDENERIGGVTIQDLAIICGDWDMPSPASDTESLPQHEFLDGEWEAEELARPRKRQKTNVLDSDFSMSIQDPQLPFEEPERVTAKLAKSIALDLNDPNLLIDELVPQNRRGERAGGDRRRDGGMNKDTAKRYNISNDPQYDALKQNHQHKVRSTLSNMASEHSLPAAKLQYPFYKVALDSKAKRSFHRPSLDIRDPKTREYRFQKIKQIKRKHTRGKDVKELFAKAEDLYLGDNANVLLLEYSEEAPTMLSNFGMGNRLINYYRKKDSDDQERPKREIGETLVLLPQDKSPYANFGHVDKGEVVPTIQNAMYRAPVFQHKGKATDFLVGMSSTWNSGSRFYIRNVENLHTVGQQFPLAEVPGQHSRKVTDAAKKRLRAMSYRIYSKSIDPLRKNAKPLSNDTIMPHLPGHDMPQTRSKMREFMKYDKGPKDSAGTWFPMPNQVVPDNETLRTWIKPEDVCLLDSMQVGVQHLQDLGINMGKEGDEEKDVDESASIELQLAPWNTTKNFLNACQGKAMLKLHGEGDPTGRGLGFSFVKTSMKGGFQAVGQSAEDQIEARKRRDAGGHLYNVAKQQKLYDEHIRGIWKRQKESLAADHEVSDTEMEDEQEEPQSGYPHGRGATPRSSVGTPAAFGRNDDESASQFSRGSVDRGEKILTIARTTTDKSGRPVTTYEKVTNPRVISQYRKRKMERRLNNLSFNEMKPTGDAELDALQRLKVEQEVQRIERNVDRRKAREKVRGRPGNSPGAAGSPGQSDANNSADGTPQKSGRGRNKDGTARKCANCGQVGHIKTNRKSVKFDCVFCESMEYIDKQGNIVDGSGRPSAARAAPNAVAGAADSCSKLVL